MGPLPRAPGGDVTERPVKQQTTSPSPSRFLVRKLDSVFDSIATGGLIASIALLALLALSPAAALAGETFIGRLYVSDAGSISNATTGYGSAGCASQTSPGGAGACDQAFPVGQGIKLTIVTPEACCVSVNRGTTDAGICVPTTAGQIFPTSTGTTPFTQALPDGGTYAGGLVSITPPAGSSSCHALVFYRSGTE